MSKKRIQVFLALIACHFVTDCYVGVWPIFKYLGGLDLRAAGLIATVAMFTGAVMQPVFGVFADHGHRRLFLLLGPLLVSLTMLFGPVSLAADGHYGLVHYTALFMLLLVANLGASMFHPVGFSMAGNSLKSNRGAMVGVFIAVGMFGFSISQRVFSIVFHVSSGHTEWMLVPAACVIGLAAIATRGRVDDTVKNSTLRDLLDRLSHVRGPLTLLYLFQALLTGYSFVFIFLMPEFLELQGCPDWFVEGGGYFFWMAGSATMVAPAGYLSDRRGVGRILIACTVLSTALYYVAILSSALPVGAYAMLFFVGGGLVGATVPICLAVGQQLAPESASMISGILVGLSWAAGSLFVALGAFLAELPGVGVTGALLWGGVTACCAIVLAVALYSRRRNANI